MMSVLHFKKWHMDQKITTTSYNFYLLLACLRASF